MNPSKDLGFYIPTEDFSLCLLQGTVDFADH